MAIRFAHSSLRDRSSAGRLGDIMGKPIQTNITHDQLHIGVVYHFNEAGDEISEHVHTELANHYSLAGKGSFLVHNAMGMLERLEEGGVMFHYPGVPHAILAECDDSYLFNMLTDPKGLDNQAKEVAAEMLANSEPLPLGTELEPPL